MDVDDASLRLRSSPPRPEAVIGDALLLVVYLIYFIGVVGYASETVALFLFFFAPVVFLIFPGGDLKKKKSCL